VTYSRIARANARHAARGAPRAHCGAALPPSCLAAAGVHILGSSGVLALDAKAASSYGAASILQLTWPVSCTRSRNLPLNLSSPVVKQNEKCAGGKRNLSRLQYNPS